MKNNFTSEGLYIGVRRGIKDNELILSISSDYSQSDHKSQLYVNEKHLAEEVESFWKNIKTKKLLGMNVSFGEIDYYDNMVDMYHTPIVRIQRGLKKARVDYNNHGCVPKDWSFDFHARFADTSTSTPILEVVKLALGYRFNPTQEKLFLKKLKPVLQKKENSINVHFDN